MVPDYLLFGFLECYDFCDLEFGGLSQCEMLYRSNLFAIVAGGRYPKYSQNTVLIYDDLTKKFVMELICPSAVKAIRMRRDK